MSTASRPRPAAKTAAKRPDDQPFDFNLDTAQPDHELTAFIFHWKGRRWEMQHLESLDVWGLLEAADGGDISAMTGAFRHALGDRWDDFRKNKLRQWELKALFRAYRQHCRINADGSPMDTPADA